ncbi:MAG: hypothetical protein COY68_04215 [Candidatus Levybacteria bacterium CG_4_10_14_0_8_um_filter_35_23]|nr:MAG: hypothetical protein COY68_04215 [Candidatus Levybacteria bacterium CG_4_10_14_0_8_um_filter_35_23]
MSKEVTIANPTNQAYGSFSRSEKRALVLNRNIGVTSGDQKGVSTETLLSAAQEYGFELFNLDNIFLAVHTLIKEEGIDMLSGNKFKRERGAVTAGVLSRLSMRRGENNVQFFLTDESGNEQELLIKNPDPEEDQTRLQSLKNDSAVYGRVLGYAKKFLKENKGFVLQEATPQQLIEVGLSIAVGEVKPDVQKKADKAIKRPDSVGVRLGLLREIVSSDIHLSQRTALKHAIESREIQLTPKFVLNNWPRDVLMIRLRQAVADRTNAFMRNENFLCDPQDLKYQTLFRLTTFSIESIFKNGITLETYLRLNGNYQNWRNILSTDPSIVAKFDINDELIESIVREQATVIGDRLRQSSLPLDQILIPSGIFAESGWVIQKRNGEVNAIQEEGVTSLSDSIPLRFEKIDPLLASQIHNDLHYIHTPRADIAFGMYVDGDDFPFSVLAFEKIDREYKQNTLLLHGYDPRKCYDLTRLYSRPGTPGNTSSSMFSMAFAYLKMNYPDIQAIMSSFMPSYATGVSMTSGGLDNPALIKPLDHVFGEKAVNGKKVYEHLTRRRREGVDGNILSSQIPLLPTIELIRELQEPKFTPMKEVEKFMVEVLKT